MTARRVRLIGWVLFGSALAAGAVIGHVNDERELREYGDRTVVVDTVDPPQGLLPITRANAHTLPRCAQEDGPGPCVWFADRMGNGLGNSFWIGTDACFHYFDPAAEARWGDKSSPCVDPYGA